VSGVDSANWISDITLPDGTIVSPNQSLAKTWRMQNTGDTTWGSGYQLVFVNGEQMGAPSAVSVPTTAPGAQADISVNLTAPSGSGIHTGYWRLRNPQGTFFGPTIWVTVNVVGNTSGHFTLFDITPASPSNATSVHLVGRIGPFPEFRSMRFVAGNEVFEMTNFKPVGSQYEISVDWNTASLPRGDYAIAFEVATVSDSGWANPERWVQTYTLNGTPTPNNHPPERPTLQSPYNFYLKDAAGADASLELCVYPTSDPDGNSVEYWFEVNGSITSGWTSSTCWTHTYSPFGYSWRVKAKDSLGAESDWSQDTWNFSVADGNVTIGDISFFQTNTNETHMCVFVTYGGIAAPDVHAFINTATDGSESGIWVMLDHYGPSAPPDCTASNQHGFWIRSPNYDTGLHLVRINAVKMDSGANATKTTTYDIAFLKPPEPQLVAPSTPANNGTYWNTLPITFFWNPALRADNDHLRVSTSVDVWNDLSPLVDVTLDSGVLSYTHTFGQDYAQLHWGIRASNSAGSSDSYGDAWFGIDRVEPACAVQALNPTQPDTVFLVNWSGSDDVAGVRSYDLQYQDLRDTTWRDWLLSVPVSKTNEFFIGQPGHTYSFRCRSTDSASNTNTYPETANTSTRIDPTTQPLTPWWDDSYGYKRNIPILNNMPSLDLPLGYPVLFHVTGDAAAEIYNLSRADCDDLRVVANNATDLNRVVQTCTSSDITVWFRAQAGIPAGQSDLTTHQIYYGNASASAPLSDPSQVWYPYYEADTAYLYFFQEGTGATALDYSGNSRHCSIDPSVQWAPSKFSNGLRFNRANFGDSQSLNCGAFTFSSFTIDFWYKPDSDGDGNIAGQLGPNGQLDWQLSDFEGRIRLDVWPCPPCASHDVRSNFNLHDAPYLGNWHHVAVTFNGGNEVKFYLDGALDSTKYLELSGINTYNVPLQIGSVGGGGQLKGNLGAFRISSGVKTSFPYGAFANITLEPTVTAGSVGTPPAAGSPDLAILSLAAYPDPSGGWVIQATAQNQGTVPTLNGFFTDVYVDHLPTGSGDYSGSLQFWVNEPITVGQIITLTTVITDLSVLGGDVPQAPLAPASEVTSTLYAQADSTGAVGEPDNTNNISAAGTEVCTASPDAYEGDDSAEAAQPLLLGESQTHNFSSVGDEDWVSFNAQAGVTYTLSTSGLGPSADTYLYLFDTDAVTLLASNDDFGGSLASQIEWTAPTDGAYYLQVKHWNPNAGGCGNLYTLTLAEATAPATGPVILAITPVTTTIGVGRTFTASVFVEAFTQTVDGAAAYLNFDPAYLQVVTMTAEATFPYILQNEFDNTTGEINFAAGNLTPPHPSGTFALVTITFTAVAETTGTPLTFNSTIPRQSDATLGGASVLNHTEGGMVAVAIANAILSGSVTLQGRPPAPDPRWITDLRVNLTVANNPSPSYVFTPTTDNTGHFTISGIVPGPYDIQVKNSHTLQNMVTVTLTSGVNLIDFGTLREGDTNDDNFVSLLDFSILVTTFGKCQGTTGYDDRADFDEDQCVTLLDFSHLATNFGQGGQAAPDHVLARPMTGTVQLMIEPMTTTVLPSQVFTLSVMVLAGSQPVDGAQGSLNFDPSLLQVRQITPGSTLPQILLNQYDNTAGTIDFAAGTFSNFPSGTFTLMQVEFEAVAPTPGTPLAFQFTLPSATEATYGGASVLGGASDGTVVVSHALFLPMVQR